jgi:hypothetical protein
MRALTVVPCLTAIAERLSPASTVTTVWAPAGDAVTRSVATRAIVRTTDLMAPARSCSGVRRRVPLLG